MASLDFKAMSKQDLIIFSRKATTAHERPSAENNYFTTRFSAYPTSKQPADWVPTKMAHIWCEQHGPSNHDTAKCRDSNLAEFKRALEAKTTDSERLELFLQTIRSFGATKPQERRQKKAAKRKHELGRSNKDSSS